MLLYGSPASPYARKVRVVAHEVSLPLVLVRADAHQIPSTYGTINPINRIPALRLDDGTMMFDSRVICEYLDSLQGCTLLPETGAMRWQTLKLQALGDGILDAAVPHYSESLRPTTQQSPARLAKYRRSVQQILAFLEGDIALLASHNVGTLTIGCALGYLDFRFAAEDWRTRCPELAGWYADTASRPAMRATVPTLAEGWQPTDGGFERKERSSCQ